jgi:hypothetical protein
MLNSKFQSFVDKYIKITNDKIAETLLKDFMFSLSPDEFCEFMIESGRYYNEAITQRVNDPTCSSAEKQMYKEQADTLFALLSAPTSLLSKAA